jgi:hypothetical protein
MKNLLNFNHPDSLNQTERNTVCQSCHCPCCCRRYQKTTAINYIFIAVVIGIFFIVFYRF